MSARKTTSVTRTYKPAPDACMRALTTLLKQSVNHEGSPALTTLEDTRGEFKHDPCAKISIHE